MATTNCDDKIINSANILPFENELHPNANTQFIGPVGHLFDSFREQILYFLNTFYQDWQQRGIVIPPIFEFKLADVTDNKVTELEEVPQRPDTLIHTRNADIAEHLMYRTICQAANDGYQAPFIAIHSLNVNDSCVKLLRNIFPKIAWDEFFLKLQDAFKDKSRRNFEYDSLLIGPKIGVVVVEVKSSQFLGQNDFKKEDHHLPRDYEKAIRQIKSIEAFLYLLQECTGARMPSTESIRMVLYTPNLEESRFADWKSSLSEKDQLKLDKKLVGITQGFKPKSQSVYEFLQNVLQCSIVKIFDNCENYYLYAQLLAGFTSMASTSTPQKSISLKEENFSLLLSLNNEMKRLDIQSPISSGMKHKSSNLVLVTNKLKKENDAFKNVPVIFLTPQQQQALQGGQRQIILGAAGTGKTLVLQTKALELLSKGESVTVVSSRSFKHRWKVLFDEHGYKNYRIYTWAKFVVDFSSMSYKEFMNTERILKSELEIFSEVEEKIKDRPGLDIISRDHIFIDDAISDIYLSHFDTWSVMLEIIAFTAKNEFEQVVWIATDPIQFDISESKIYMEEVVQRRDLILKYGEIYGFSLILLNQVMRCSEEIFHMAYDTFDWHWASLKPVLGHKIMGYLPNCISRHFDTYHEAWAAIMKELPEILMSIFGNKAQHLNAVAVLLSGTVDTINCRKECLAHLKSTCAQITVTEINEVTDKQEKPFDPLLSEHPPLFRANSVVVGASGVTPSCEWPIVIHMIAMDLQKSSSGNGRQLLQYVQYLARSRAMTTYIERFHTYDTKV